MAQYGQSQYGFSQYGQSSVAPEPFPPDPEQPREPDFFYAVDSPFRFEEDGDLALTQDEKAIEDNMKNSVFIQKFGIPLRSQIGSRVPLSPFEPNDLATAQALTFDIVEAIREGEDRVYVDSAQVVTNSEQTELSIIVPYLHKASSGGWQSYRMAMPETKTVR
jgi:hypothetical protein